MSMDNSQLQIKTPNVDVNIEGRTISLRPITEKEINDKYLSWLNDPTINQFLEVRHRKQTMEDIYNYTNSLRSREGCEIFAIFSKRNNNHVGNVAITNFNESNQGIAIYGVVIGDQRAAMVGVGAEAEALIIEFLFQSAEIRKIKANGHEANYKAWRLLESLGFKREAVLRKEAVLSTSEICDIYCYGIFKEEWERQREKLRFLLSHVQIIDKRKMANALKD